MTSFKPILGTLILVFGLGLILNVFVSPFVDTTEPQVNSSLEGLVGFVEDGFYFDLPILGNETINPATWLWLGHDATTDFVVEQLTLMTYIPDAILVPLMIILLIALIYSFVIIIKDLVPFT